MLLSKPSLVFEKKMEVLFLPRSSLKHYKHEACGFKHTRAGGQPDVLCSTCTSLRLSTHTGYTIHKHSQPDVLFNLHLRPNTATHTGYTTHKHSQPDVLFNLHLLRLTQQHTPGYTIHKHSQPDVCVFNLVHLLRPPYPEVVHRRIPPCNAPCRACRLWPSATHRYHAIWLYGHTYVNYSW